MSTITSIIPKSRYRRVSKGGAFSAARFNASLQEIIQEIQELQSKWNDTLKPLLDTLPLGSNDDEFPSIGSDIDPIVNGLSGDQLWIDETATSASDELFYSSTDNRKLTIKESILALSARVNSNLETLQVLVNATIPTRTQQFHSVITVTAGGTSTIRWRVPFDCTITAIKLDSQTAPSTAGTYTMAVAAAGNNLLNSSTFDMTTLVSNTLKNVTLTTITSDLDLSGGTLVTVTFTSNNGDLTGTNLTLDIHYQN